VYLGLWRTGIRGIQEGRGRRAACISHHHHHRHLFLIFLARRFWIRKRRWRAEGGNVLGWVGLGIGFGCFACVCYYGLLLASLRALPLCETHSPLPINQLCALLDWNIYIYPSILGVPTPHSSATDGVLLRIRRGRGKPVCIF
jgi:hypothetical protein